MQKVYIYVVDRDFGFAPNPFHGFCSLATCKPVIRKAAKVGDWVIGVGGNRLKATGKCVFAMKVTKKITFNEYWSNSEYKDKKPVRNGSKKMMLGDNIYYFDDSKSEWSQAHSHHSKPDGTINYHNLEKDTKSNFILISEHFYYFGNNAPVIPEHILDEIGYKNGIGHRVFDFSTARKLIEWLEAEYSPYLNLILGDPFDFDKSAAYYSTDKNKITN